MLFCIVGSFAITNSTYGIVVMLVFGLVGWWLESNDIPMAPLVLGIVLGEMLEQNFATSLIKADGSLLAFFTRPIAGVLGVLTVLVWGWIALQGVKGQRKEGLDTAQAN